MPLCFTNFYLGLLFSIRSEFITPNATYRIPCNVNCAVFFDIDHDGTNELILGGNNRNLFVYKFGEKITFYKEVNTRNNQIHSMALHDGMLIIGFVSGALGIVPSIDTVIIIEPKYINFKNDPLTVVGNIKFGENNCIAMCGLSGEVIILDPLKHFQISELLHTKGTQMFNSSMGKTKQNYYQHYDYILNIQHEILSISAHHFVTTSTDSQVVISSWDGIIYILDKDKNIVTYNFKSPLANCYCGLFSLTPRHNNELVLVLSTFNEDNLHIYYNIQLQSMKATTMYDYLKTDPELCSLLSEFATTTLDPSTTHNTASLIHSLLYDH